MEQEHIHQQLLQPSFYPEQPSSVDFLETHISRLYLLDRHVYKMKKPVNLGFLDFSTPEKRRFFCEEEVRLNRRFCPDTYLGIVSICMQDNNLRFGPPGEPVEYLVRMQRLPEDKMLTRLLDAAADGLPDEMARLGQRLADLHLAEPACNHDEGYSDLMHVRRNWDENFRQTGPFIGSCISPEGFARLHDYVQRFLEDHEDLIDQREKEGWVRECHGDLHAGNVCMTDPVRIYDCIEFNRRFRVSDILADIAFLLMDIDHHGRADLAALLLKAYRERLAAPVPDSLLCFYKVYRAAVRGKISSFLSADPDVTAERRERSRLGAIDYFNRALGYLIPPSLLITCGLMGTGKSRLAAALAPALHGEVIRSDVLRLRFKQAPDEGARAGFGQGPYSRETTDIVYRLLAEQARELLTAGRTVILDASFADDGQRRRMQQLAIECNVPFAVLYCTIPRTVTLQRLQKRTEQGRDASDGRVELYDRQAAGFHYPTEDEPVIGIDTSGPVDLACNNALARLEAMIGASGQKKDAV